MDRTQRELERQLAQAQAEQDKLRAREAQLEAQASQAVAAVGAQAHALVQQAEAAVPAVASEMVAQALLDKWTEASRKAAGGTDLEAAGLLKSTSELGPLLLGTDFRVRLQAAGLSEGGEIGKSGHTGRKAAPGGPHRWTVMSTGRFR